MRSQNAGRWRRRVVVLGVVDGGGWHSDGEALEDVRKRWAGSKDITAAG